MRPDTAIPVTTAAEFSGQSERRHGSRTPTLFSLLYSCMDSGRMLIGDGAVTDLSSSGIGIRGNQSVTPGTKATLFINLPGMKEPFCITQSRVSWVKGCRFGVEMETLTLEEKNYLRFVL
ncbi:MAG: PilZ domain-containing protein [Nitrospiraceae bacterium]|nr:MAG: PilZ domain-containing protein [Nitrospiraceae bacterium]